jgi:uncharacterized protein YecT (DUF1311 family)
MEIRSMRRFVFVFCAALAAAPAALAYECEDQTQSGLNACAEAAYRKADAALNNVYKQIVRRLKDDAPTAKLLVMAQKAWIDYRDAECEFSSSGVIGGSLYPMTLAICQEAMTTRRTRELGEYLKCGEGDAGCPVPAR